MDILELTEEEIDELITSDKVLEAILKDLA